MRKFIQYIKSQGAMRAFLGFMGASILLILLLGFIFYTRVTSGYYGDLPTVEQLSDIENNTASALYDVNDKVLGRYYVQERTNVDFGSLSPYLVDALIATEDARFFEHDGVDSRSLLRVFVKTLLMQQNSAGGGSTISQQLAKNLYPRKNHGRLTMLVNKVQEAIIAKRLEKAYSKEDIITLYFNTVPFSDNAFGIATACQRYFNKTTAEINLQEAAVLVGMLKGTNQYNPRISPDRSKIRRNTVLAQMEKYDKISNAEADSLKALPLTLDYNQITHNEGPAPYFREHLRGEIVNILKTINNNEDKKYNLYTDGLKIYTTLDADMQRYAEEATLEHMEQLQKSFNAHWGNRKPWSSNSKILEDAVQRTPRYQKLKAQGVAFEEIQKIFQEKRAMTVFDYSGEVEVEMSPLDSIQHYLQFLNAGFMAMDPQTGHIKAWVGGINHKYFKYDHVNRRTKRQVGSTFKPIVYAAALEAGADPCEYLPNVQESYEEYEDWSPKNSDGKYEGYYAMQGALTESVNTISVQHLLNTGIDETRNLAKTMGIESNIPEAPAIALGAANISLTEMLSAYAVFSNGGQYTAPVYLLRIEDKHGKVIYEQEKLEGRQALQPETAEIMRELLKNVVNQGTGARLRYRYGLQNDIAGKTGTTQAHADGWFIGITPKLIAGSWVGADDPRIHFRSLNLGQAANTALPVYGLFMKKVNSDEKFKTMAFQRFPTPSENTKALLDCAPFVEEKPGGLFDFLFGSQKNKTEEKTLEERNRENRSNNHRAPKPKSQKKRKGFFNRVKGLFEN